MTSEEWTAAFKAVANFDGPALPDPDQRIGKLLELWKIPPNSSWLRKLDDNDDARWSGKHRRYRRGDLESPQRGEHELEKEILESHFDDVRCFGARLVDGVNAFPLLKRRSGIQADMVLLTELEGQFELLVVELKWSDDGHGGSNNPWYGLVENLCQLRLFASNEVATAFFHRRQPDLRLPTQIPIAGMVLAPNRYFAYSGQKSRSMLPARRLIEEMRRVHDVDLRLATYDREADVIEALEASKLPAT